MGNEQSNGGGRGSGLSRQGSSASSGNKKRKSQDNLMLPTKNDSHKSGGSGRGMFGGSQNGDFKDNIDFANLGLGLRDEVNVMSAFDNESLPQSHQIQDLSQQIQSKKNQNQSSGGASSSKNSNSNSNGSTSN